MTYELTVSIPCVSDKDAKVIVEALSPELQQRIAKANIQLHFDNNTVFLEIKTKDVSTLRAAANSYIRWIETAVNVHQLV
jgi:tRNA threonylcarbamoyladenosine modification (KEOPS) complex  Pcc1 subunit